MVRRDLLIDGLDRHCIKLLLNKAYVAATPRGAFGDAGRDYLRLSYATSQERIREALIRMERVLA